MKIEPYAIGATLDLAGGLHTYLCTRIFAMMQPYYRELPYGFEVLAENLTDPSHLPFAHHGVLNRR